MIGGSEWEGMSLGQMMLSSFNEGREAPHPLFFHAAQVSFCIMYSAELYVLHMTNYWTFF
jgi:hypothetical protein